ncbi:hypothetical protein [Robiginitomaculum antarcticum]|uniref:hypothetical protein n=1 Tax=Robiginitomaculum antarcticum TaxID=437507 RepID=UPI0003757899|nr:hypothetical protein [Robiginitomaculum antarcticum]
MRALIVILAAMVSAYAVLAFFPAQWAAALALPQDARRQAQFTGTVWRGEVKPNVKLGLAPIVYTLSPKALISGGDYFEFRSNGALILRGSGSHKRVNSLHISGPSYRLWPY